MDPYKESGPLDCSVVINQSLITGKTAIVTGGADGIGEGYVRALIAAGVYVIIGDVNETRGQTLALELKRAKFVKCDVTKWEDQLNLFQQAVAFSPSKRIDIVVVNAGISGVDSMFAFEDQEAPVKPPLNILNVNLIGASYTIKLALHYFRRQHGSQPEPMQDTCLILQGSMGGYMEAAATLEYCASKYGLRGIMKCLRRTSWMHGTRVNYIAPGFVKTSIMSEQVAETLRAADISFATVEDAASALMRLVCDPGANGRTLSVLSRDLAPRGFTDFNLDEFPEGSLLRVTQDKSLASAHRHKEALQKR